MALISKITNGEWCNEKDWSIDYPELTDYV